MSIVSVSRRAGPPHFGHDTLTKSGTCASGESPRPVKLVTLGSSTGSCSNGHRHDAARVAVHHRNRGAPVPLSRDAPVLQAELHRPLADALLLHPLAHARQRHLRRQAGELARLDEPPIVFEGPVDVLGRVSELRIRVDDNLDRQAVLGRELEVALIVRRHRHDRASAVVSQNKVRYPDRNAFAP